MMAICVESSHAKGMGHLFRGIHLAYCLSRHHRRFIILVNDHAPSLRQLAHHGLPYRTVPVPGGPEDWESEVIAQHGIDLWINDRLNTDGAHAVRIKKHKIALVTFDDTGSGAALSDLHIAPLAGCRQNRLTGRRILTGCQYLILDPQLAAWRRPRTRLGKLLVSLGGSDTHGVVLKVVDMLKQSNVPATVHTGPAFAHHDELRREADGAFDIVSSVPSMGSLYAEHDLAITGGGITPFEAAVTGLPTVIIANETFEVPTGRYLASEGAARFAGHHAALTSTGLISSLTQAQEQLTAMSARCRKIVPADGVENAYDAICQYS